MCFTELKKKKINDVCVLFKQYLTWKQNSYFQIDLLMVAGHQRSDRYRVDCIYVARVLPKEETVSVQGAKKVSFTA